jgi:hypothetical protein
VLALVVLTAILILFYILLACSDFVLQYWWVNDIHTSPHFDETNFVSFSLFWFLLIHLTSNHIGSQVSASAVSCLCRIHNFSLLLLHAGLDFTN